MSAKVVIGKAMINVLLGYSFQVVVYARKPSKLDDSIITNSLVTIYKGELTDAAALRRAMMGVHAVLSSLGPKVTMGPFHPLGTPLAKAYALIIELMKERGIRRLILLGTTSMKDPNDNFSLEFKALVSGVALFATNAYRVCPPFLCPSTQHLTSTHFQDVVAIGETVRAEPDIDYTIVRVPILTDEMSSNFVVGYVGDKHMKTTLPRQAFAAFVVQELYRNQWVRKQPLISGP